MLEGNLFKVLERRVEGNTLTARVQILEDSTIYKGHFPGFAITPGVCLVEIARELALGCLPEGGDIASAKEIKFLSPVLPQGSPLDIEETFSEDGTVVAAISRDGLLHAKMKFKMQTTL